MRIVNLLNLSKDQHQVKNIHGILYMLSFCPVQVENFESAKVTQKLGHTREGSLKYGLLFFINGQFLSICVW